MEAILSGDMEAVHSSADDVHSGAEPRARSGRGSRIRRPSEEQDEAVRAALKGLEPETLSLSDLMMRYLDDITETRGRGIEWASVAEAMNGALGTSLSADALRRTYKLLVRDGE